MADKISAASVLSTPSGFAEGILEVPLYDWQKKIIDETDNLALARNKITVRAPNGSGKSERVIACMALRFISVAPKGRVVITSKDGRQIDNQIWPALTKRRGKFKDYVWNYREIKTPRGGLITAFTTDEAGRMEGWHASIPLDNKGRPITDSPEFSPLLIIVDEAKSVQEDMYASIDRCTFNHLMLISSTGLMQGRFYESHTSLDGWKRFKIGLPECPHIPKADIDDILATYGSDHPFTLSRLYSEFMSQDEGTAFFVTLADIDKLRESPPDKKKGDTCAFVDFAGGGDENVLAVRRGNVVEIVRAWKERNEMAALGELITLFRSEGLKGSEIWGDNAGAGKVMMARLAEAGWNLNKFNAGERAQDDRTFFNRGSEVWEQGGKAIKDGKIRLPKDPILYAQLYSRRRLYRSDGRLWAEPKQGEQSMAKRGVKSPDRADAVMGVIAIKRPEAYSSAMDILPAFMAMSDGVGLADAENRIAMVAGD